MMVIHQPCVHKCLRTELPKLLPLPAMFAVQALHTVTYDKKSKNSEEFSRIFHILIEFFRGMRKMKDSKV